MTAIELLAPAKDVACGIAAIDSGADAVYIGAPRFGAREAAGNSLEDLAELIRHAHTYWAKVYPTVNTLLNDDELPHAVRLIERLYEMGADGVIIQDAGLLECKLPPIPIIASTQMHNHTPERVAFLEAVGIRRVILARELDLDQIRDIRQKTNTIELECFIHGSLCVCYSGQCYLSYTLGGRSGNRGQCAQPCRKPYTLVDGSGRVLAKNRHLLSLRDLNLSAHLAELIRAGICSFKIEGRLKDRAYVTNVVSYYRMKLDAVLEEMGLKKSSSGTCYADFTPDVSKTFNRGYCTYFLHGRGGKIGALDTPKMVGEPIGRVITAGARAISVDAKVPLHNGDGICFFARDGELHGTSVNGVNGDIITPERMEGLEAGTLLYRNHDHEFLTTLEKCRPERKIMVQFTVREAPNGVLLLVEDEDGNRAEYLHTCEKVQAEKPEAALESMRKQLMKCGGSEYECDKVVLGLPNPFFFPVSVLNTLRRETLDRLSAVRAANRPVAKGKILRNSVPYPAKTLTFEGNVLNHWADAFYRRHGVTSIETAAECGRNLQGRKVMTTRYCLKHELGLCPRQKNAPRVTDPLALLDAEGHRLPLRFNCAACEMEVYLERVGE